jgi:hypothetical protein
MGECDAVVTRARKECEKPGKHPQNMGYSRRAIFTTKTGAKLPKRWAIVGE